MFADRTNWELAANKLTMLLDELRRQNAPLLDLTESNPTACGFSYPPEVLSALANPNNLRYAPEAQGLLSARQAVCAYYAKKGIQLKPEQIFLTASTSEAYSFLFRLLLNPGDEALFPAPSYPLFQFLVDLNDIEMKTYPLVYGTTGWDIDSRELQDQISTRTRAIVLVNPNNPTGSYIKSTEMAVINQCCGKHGLAIIADEVFLDYPFAGQEASHLSLANNASSLTFVMGGLSKALALPQMKLAWIVVNGPEPAVEKAIARLEVITDTYLSVNTPVQNALPVWLNYQDVVQRQIRERTANNREYVLNNMPSKNGVRFLQAQGGWYVVLRLPEDTDEETFVLDLLREDHVYIHPGYFFDFSEGAHAVVSLLPAEDVFQQGFQRLRERIK
jgi:alanine-synthesizing transaminase